MLDVWLMAFSNPRAATSAAGADGASRFSRVELPYRDLRLRGVLQVLAITHPSVLPPPC